MSVRVAIADDDRLFAESLMIALAQDDRVDIVGIAADGVEALELVEEYRPDVLVLDVAMPRMNGIAALRELRERGDSCRVVIITGAPTLEIEDDAAALGADAFLLKSTATSELVHVVLLTAALGVSPPN